MLSSSGSATSASLTVLIAAEFGGALFAFFEESLCFIEQPGVFKATPIASGERWQQAHVGISEGVSWCNFATAMPMTDRRRSSARRARLSPCSAHIGNGPNSSAGVAQSRSFDDHTFGGCF